MLEKLNELESNEVAILLVSVNFALINSPLIWLVIFSVVSPA